MMYADGELSSAGRQAVDRFVMENPDLAEELALFEQLQLPADDISFTGKHSLYRFEVEGITAANHEEQFLLYVDNELDQTAKEKVEVFVLQNPAYQDAFTLLKQTKLPVETVVFADKASLYRKEEKRPVAFMYWGRMAAAAVFIGVAVLVWTLLPKDNSSVQNIAKVRSGGATGKIVSSEKKPESSREVSAENNTNTLAGANTVTKSAVITGGVQKESSRPTATDATTSPANLIAANVTVPVEDKQQTASTVNSATEEKQAVTDRTIAANFSEENSQTVKLIPHPDEEAAPANVHNAVYRELDTDDEKKSLYLGSLEINKDKLRGFFRKAGSIFRSKAKQQEEDNKTEAATPAGIRTLK